MSARYCGRFRDIIVRILYDEFEYLFSEEDNGRSNVYPNINHWDTGDWSSPLASKKRSMPSTPHRGSSDFQQQQKDSHCSHGRISGFYDRDLQVTVTHTTPRCPCIAAGFVHVCCSPRVFTQPKYRSDRGVTQSKNMSFQSVHSSCQPVQTKPRCLGRHRSRMCTNLICRSALHNSRPTDWTQSRRETPRSCTL